MNIISLLVSDYTFRTIAMGCMLLGIVSGVLGCFAILRKQSLLGDAVSHASLPGVCLAFMITHIKNTEILLLGALFIGIVCIGLIYLIQNYTKIKFDSALAFILSVFFGLGLVLLSYLNKLPGANKSGLNRFIFGQASTFVERDVKLMFYTGLLLLAIIILFWKEFKIVSFDAEFARTLGFPSKKIGISISVLIVVTVIIGIQAAGVILISAMIISPAVAARQWTDKLSVMVILSGIFGGFAGLTGTLVSITESNLPTGPVIVLIISLIVIFSILFSPKRGIIFKFSMNRKKRKMLSEKLKNKKSELSSLKGGIKS
ncbi:metal ABC transporter permease [Pseudoleptotrichia goodfellowii]|jgi:zinc transport system membrane protein troC|uniref:ABC transporter, permease component n=1 Tax=Pseudoleptotrichia goodfellowii TaxID=157692 RepID=A0A510JB46_9FUSO|nr:metal ABC transporter permease [Pseudoleptotrichia goodfellowii]MBF4806748.1 metal ABC transporter permease [Pseudoleptotrichia goodfellowii]BBM36394.1 ABC transporter, permease component [Pseudoleptotrichia goodfellowii]